MLRSSENTVEQQTRLVISRINQTEKFFDELGNGLANYNRKNARLRDKLDDLGKLFTFTETTSQSLSIDRGLSSFGKELTHLADLRDWETNQMESKILSEIVRYENVCKAIREEVKINASIRNKEVLRKKAAEQRRGSTVLRADQDFEKIIEDFEEQKNKDLKDILLNLVQIQLKVHLEGINRLTEMYDKVKDIDCQEDAIKFRDQILDNKDAEVKLDKRRSQSMGALLMTTTNPFRNRSARQKNRSHENLIEVDAGSQKDTPTARIQLTRNEETEDSVNDEEGTESETEGENHFQERHLSVPK